MLVAPGVSSHPLGTFKPFAVGTAGLLAALLNTKLTAAPVAPSTDSNVAVAHSLAGIVS